MLIIQPIIIKSITTYCNQMQSSLGMAAEFELVSPIVSIALLPKLVFNKLTINNKYFKTSSSRGWIETIHYE
jgi:hypothetical protein